MFCAKTSTSLCKPRESLINLLLNCFVYEAFIVRISADIDQHLVFTISHLITTVIVSNTSKFRSEFRMNPYQGAVVWQQRSFTAKTVADLAAANETHASTVAKSEADGCTRVCHQVQTRQQG